MIAKPKVFRDKRGRRIKPGDTLRRYFFARWREHPGRRRVAVESLSGREVIVSDEGNLLAATEHWVEYHVKWLGACLIAERGDCSDFQVLTQAEKFDAKGRAVFDGCGFHYMNNAFKSNVYEIT